MTGAKVLIIDDDAKHRESLSDVVDSFGFSVDTAPGPDDAKSKITANGPFHLVLLDYMFGPSKKTGLDALAELRQMLPESEVPILLMTGYASLDVAVRALRQGLSDFLIKPIDPNYLRHTMEKHLEKARLLKENRRLFMELQDKNAELARLNDFKGKFLSFCAHDLANTVSSCMMASDLLRGYLAGSENIQAKRFMELLGESLEQMRRLIGDLVDTSAIEKGKFNIERTVTTLGEFLAAPIFSFIREKSKVKDVEAVIDCRLDPSTSLYTDSKRVIQVLANLLENALRYTPAKGRLSCLIEGDPQGGAVVFRVADSGEGIDQEDLPHLFESFYQGKNPTKRGRLGLGLSIAKEIVEGHGGRIWAESGGQGKGTTFSFKIPLKEGPTPLSLDPFDSTQGHGKHGRGDEGTWKGNKGPLSDSSPASGGAYPPQREAMEEQ